MPKSTDPDLVEVGWKIYIPSAEEAAAFLATLVPVAGAPAPTPVSGELQGDVPWDPKSTHTVNETVTVTSGATLTIAEGAIVHFKEGTSLVIDKNGKLVVEGKKGAPVKFMAEDGGGAGWWGGIRFIGGSSGTMDWCTVMSATTNIFIQGSSPTITNCEIREATVRGIDVAGGHPTEVTSPTIKYNRIYHNHWGLHFTKGAKGTAAHNLIYCNQRQGSGKDEGGTPNGIHIWDHAEPVIHHNLIYSSPWGIEIGKGSEGKIERNLFAECARGILYYDFENAMKTELSTPWVENNYFWHMGEDKSTIYTIARPNESILFIGGWPVTMIDETGDTTTLEFMQRIMITGTVGGNAPGHNPKFKNEISRAFTLTVGSPAANYGPNDGSTNIQP